MLDYHAQSFIPLGTDPRVVDTELVVNEEEKQAALQILRDHGLNQKKWAMIHPAARYWFKAWAPERFAALGDALIQKGYHAVLVGSDSETSVAEHVMEASQYSCISLVGKTSLRELAGLMQACDVLNIIRDSRLRDSGGKEKVEMHHVRHIRKRGEKVKGFTLIMAAINRTDPNLSKLSPGNSQRQI